MPIVIANIEKAKKKGKKKYEPPRIRQGTLKLKRKQESEREEQGMSH